MPFEKIIFRVHAIQRMAQRGILDDVVKEVLRSGKVIEDYPRDIPYPSYLMLGWASNRPIHVLCSLAPNSTSLSQKWHKNRCGIWPTISG